MSQSEQKRRKLLLARGDMLANIRLLFERPQFLSGAITPLRSESAWRVDSALSKWLPLGA